MPVRAQYTSPITTKVRSFFANSNRLRLYNLIIANKDPKLLQYIPPAYLNLDITWRCNFNCIGCIDGGVVGRESNRKLDMDWSMVQDLLKYAKENDLRGFIVQGGEPLLYPKIDKFLHACAELNLAVRLVTNGSKIFRHRDAIIAALQHHGSSIRVSINADTAHFPSFTGSKVGLDKIFAGIKELTGAGATGVTAGTVVFGKQFEDLGMPSNISQLDEIAARAAAAGIERLFFLPARDPLTKGIKLLTPNELSVLYALRQNWENRMQISLGDRFYSWFELPSRRHRLDLTPCSIGLLRTVVGSDGKLFICTDHRGEEAAVIGDISQGKTFAQVWHSEERVMKQIRFSPETHCRNITCDKQHLNRIIASEKLRFTKNGNTIVQNLILPDALTREIPFF
jgi:MoaA/NifB/PqqE/SkfB family radical SAM enzyme